LADSCEKLNFGITAPELSLLDSQDITDHLAYRKLGHFTTQLWRQVETNRFVSGWHIDAICEHLEAVTENQIRHLMVLMPPRHMKSLSVSVMWPAWVWLRQPHIRFLYASYAHSLSVRDSVKCRRIICSPRYWELASTFLPEFRLEDDQNTKLRFDNNYGGCRIATSVDGALTGEGGDIIVIDDPHNVRESESELIRTNTISWWDEAMSTRLNDRKTGHYVIVEQRSHEKDLVGHVQETLAKEDPEDWTILCLPARYEGETRYFTPLAFEDPRITPGEPLWPEKWDDKELRSVEKQLGSYGTAAQLQQRPAPREGGMIQSRWFEVVKHGPTKPKKRIRFWDMAATRQIAKNDPDWTAGARLSVDDDNTVYIEHIAHLRDTPLENQKEVTHRADTDPKDTRIFMEEEGGASGKNSIDTYQRQVIPGHSFRGIRTTGNKEAYIDPLAAYAEAGNVKVVEGPWNTKFFKEVDLFPNAAHDDMLDAVAKGYCQLFPRKRARVWGSKPREDVVNRARKKLIAMGRTKQR